MFLFIVLIVQVQFDKSEPSSETGLAVIDNDTPIAAMDDLTSEGQSNGVVIRAKRYYGCGCGCCGCGCCATVAPAATVAPCGCGCCGCGYG
uniref:RxLR effector protein n=1 Tax=Caenorhabditis tropicalis TaxID=1561998 RepID=A0A1I7U199_9PELO